MKNTQTIFISLLLTLFCYESINTLNMDFSKISPESFYLIPQNNKIDSHTNSLVVTDFKKTIWSPSLREKCKSNQNFRLLEEAFPKNTAKKINQDAIVQIPKIIHQMWIGPKPIPAYLLEFQQSIFKLHPGWLYKLWTNEDLKKITLHNQALFDKTPNMGEKVDIFRYEILYTYGGLYLDADFKLLKPFDSLHTLYDFFVGIHPPLHEAFLANGLIACRAGHPIVEDMISSIDLYFNDPQPRMGIDITRTGPKHFTRSFFKYVQINKENLIALPPQYFYGTASLEAFGLHYWKASWQYETGNQFYKDEEAK